ncbi:MAG: 3-oxoacyl-ACP reductase FabG [Anaerolineae bacterium]|nr:MAG: 3-oxoacyl-ACP reductase FabG [Anaerolineae bacterium]
MKRIALITGAARGIGLATAIGFSQHDWEVWAVDRDETPDLPVGAEFRKVDLTDGTAVEDLFDELSKERGRLDALVNNAAILTAKPILETTDSDWNMIQRTNLEAVFRACKVAYPLLEKAAGAIVNVSSVHAMATSPNIGAYAASKGGVLALTRALALEYGPGGVRVNAVLPGAVDTDMLLRGLERGLMSGASIEAQIEALGKRTALGRVGKPQEIASAIRFLADAQQSSYITGQSLVIDGGALARLSIE